MRTLVIVLVLVVGFIAGQVVPTVPALADWTVGENQNFFLDAAKTADGLKNIYLQGKFLSDLADSENIGVDPNYVDVPPWTKAEMTDLKVVFADLETLLTTTGVTAAPAGGIPRLDKLNAVILGLQ